jgi:hypothetical protein
MYNLLASNSRSAISSGRLYAARYKDVTINLTLKSIDYEVLECRDQSRAGQSQLPGKLRHQPGRAARSRDGNGIGVGGSGWKVVWEDGMIMPELRGGNRVVMDINTPARGNIYDIEGDLLVGQSDAYALGLIPGEIGDGEEGRLLTELSRLTGKTPSRSRPLRRHPRCSMVCAGRRGFSRTSPGSL